MKRAAVTVVLLACLTVVSGLTGGCSYGGEPPADGVFAAGEGARDGGGVEPFAPEGFVRLFDGRTLDGWKGLVEPEKGPPARMKLRPLELAAAQAAADAKMREHWSVDVDGTLFFDGKGDSLCTARDYTDFELIVDWMIPPAGDSGIYLRGSPQVQIWETAVGSGGLYNNQKHENNPLEKADKPVGQWNRFFIRMRGERVTVWLNGVLVTNDEVMENYWERKKPMYPSGQIELQSHGGPLWFRNVWVRELE